MTTRVSATKVLLVDDHPVVREGVRMFLGTRTDLEVIGEAGTGVEALAAVVRQQPDLVLLDIDLGGEDGLDLLPRLLTAAPAARVIVLTGIRDARVHQEALARGARGLVLKDKVRVVLLKAIDKVAQGEYWFERTILTRQLDRAAAAPAPDSDEARIASLTAREREIVTLIGRGLKNQQIGEALFISEKTVRNHITAIFAKIGVSDRFELAIFAYRHNLARVPL